MVYILLVLLILFYSFQSFFCKKYSQHYPGKENLSSPVFTVVCASVVFLFSFLMTGFSFSASPLTILFSLICGLSLFMYNTTLINSSANGPYSILMVFNLSGGIIIPAISASLFGDKITIIKIIGIGIVVFSVYLISKKDDDTFKDKKKFFIFSLLLNISNGVYGAMLSVQQRVTGIAEKEEMVALSYLFAVIFSSIILLVKEKKNVLKHFKQTKKSLIYLLICSLITALAISVLAYLISTGFDLTLLYTLDNACVLLMSVLISVAIFKEKLSKINILGCIILCITLVVMTMFG